MTTSPQQARDAFKELSRHLGKDVSLACVKTLVMFINEVEIQQNPQTPALLKPKLDWT